VHSKSDQSDDGPVAEIGLHFGIEAPAFGCSFEEISAQPEVDLGVVGWYEKAEAVQEKKRLWMLDCKPLMADADDREWYLSI
jgi:hypothetical protein